MDAKSLAGQALLELKDGLGAAWSSLTVEEQQLCRDITEEVASASISVLMGITGADARLDRAKASARAIAFGGVLIAKGILEEKILSAIGKGIQILIGVVLSKI